MPGDNNDRSGAGGGGSSSASNSDSGSHGSQGAASGGAGNPARAQDDQPLTVAALRELLAEERRESDKRLNRAITTHLRRFQKPASNDNGSGSSNARDDGHDDDDDADRDNNGAGDRTRQDGSNSSQTQGRQQNQQPDQRNEKDRGRDELSRRERAQLRAMRTQLETLEAEREAAKAESAKRNREEKFKDLVKRADPVDIDDAFRVLVADPSLKVSDDGQEFFAVGRDNAEVDLEDWIKKEVGRRPHLLKTTQRDGRGPVGRGGPPATGAKKIDRSLSAEQRLEQLHAKGGF